MRLLILSSEIKIHLTIFYISNMDKNEACNIGLGNMGEVLFSWRGICR